MASADIFINQTASGMKKDASTDHLKISVGSVNPLASINSVETQALTVGVAEVVFPSTALSTINEITVQAAVDNTDSIVVGKTGILGDASVGGWELAPGAMIPLPVADIANLYAISSSAAQRLLIVYIQAEA